MEVCAMSAASSLRDRQSVWDFELEDLENWAALKGPDICFAGGNRQDNELMKLGRRAISSLKKFLKIWF